MNGLTRRALLGQAMSCGTVLASRLPTFTYRRAKQCVEVLRGGMKIQEVASAKPGYLWVDEVRRRLFVTNEIEEYEGMPTGTVESYAIAPASGLIELISRQVLALSAVRPRHFAISPDGRFMVVAVYGGGAYNVLPIDGEGRMGRVSQAIKEIGFGRDSVMQATAHPHSVVFDDSGEFVAGTDFGCDRINVFAFHDGRLRKVAQLAAPAGSGPAELCLARREQGLEMLVNHKLGNFRGRYWSKSSEPIAS